MPADESPVVAWVQGCCALQSECRRDTIVVRNRELQLVDALPSAAIHWTRPSVARIWITVLLLLVVTLILEIPCNM